MRIPNWLTYPVMALASVYHVAINGWAGFLFSMEGTIVGIGVLIIPYLLGGMGAGDAKLMGAVGALLGPKGVFLAFLFTALIGGGYALVVIVLHGFLKETFQRYGIMLKHFYLTGKLLYLPPAEKEKKPKLRYGLAITAGTLLSVFMKEKASEIIMFL
jgi:prepilin peptidase CpaA